MDNRRYFENDKGIVPIILSCPHGGYKKPRIIPTRENGIIIPDRNTYIIGKGIVQALKEKKIDIYYIFSKVHRCKIDLNRPPRSSITFNQSSKVAKDVYHYYHDKILEFTQDCLKFHKKCLFIDLHGFTKPHKYYPDIIFGNIFGNTLTIKNKLKNLKLSGYWGFSQIIKELSKHFSLNDGLSPSEFNLPFSGGYITHQFNKKDRINAFQLEVAKHIRLDLKLIQKFIKDFVLAIINCLE